MKQGAIDLLNSERGVLCVLLVIAVTVLVIVGKVSADDWLNYTKWIAITLVASKTVTSALETVASGQTDRAAIAVAKPAVASTTATETSSVTSTTPVS